MQAAQAAQDYSAALAPSLSITPGWTIPAPPNAAIGQGYPASVPAAASATYAWTVTAGSATLINATTAVVTFTPQSAGSITLHCVRTDPGNGTLSANYTVTASVGAVLNARPATISQGQGTLLLATFTGTTGVVNPGAIPISSNVGFTVQPAGTTTYTLNVDGVDEATATVTVAQYTPKFLYVANNGFQQPVRVHPQRRQWGPRAHGFAGLRHAGRGISPAGSSPLRKASTWSSPARARVLSTSTASTPPPAPSPR